MANPDFPGLVQVPPSDREIAKRRLLRWSFFAIAIIFGFSALNEWLNPSDNQTDCRQGLDPGNSLESREACNQAETDQAIADGDSIQHNTTVAAASQETVSPKPQTPTVSPSPQPVQAQKEPHTTQASLPSTQHHKPDPSVRTVTPSQEKSTSTTQTVKPVTTRPPDARLAEQGDAFAQYRLGKFYATHSGPEAPESVSWYKKASRGLRRLAETGNGEAMYVLGVMYAFGRGVQVDVKEARRWLTRAVEHKVVAARPVLARLIEKHKLAEADRTDNGG
ncbi:MAG: hypothetical protein OEY86_15040 [Nitrospira sp.]|nr:hypothetical protein [Nitrospira sp.]